MDFGEAGQKLREIRKLTRQVQDQLRENTGHLAQVARLAHEYADNGPSAQGREAESSIVRNLVESIDALAAATEKMRSAQLTLNAARDAAAESDKRREQAARKLKI